MPTAKELTIRLRIGPALSERPAVPSLTKKVNIVHFSPPLGEGFGAFRGERPCQGQEVLDKRAELSGDGYRSNQTFTRRASLARAFRGSAKQTLYIDYAYCGVDPGTIRLC